MKVRYFKRLESCFGVFFPLGIEILKHQEPCASNNSKHPSVTYLLGI